MAEKHIGSSFDDFLEKESLLEDVRNTAAKRILSITLVTLQKAAMVMGKRIRLELVPMD